MFPFDQDDVHNLALVGWKEGRNGGPPSMDAVQRVCVSRAGKPGFGHTLHDVIYGKNQFTSMSVPSDREYNLDPEKASGPDAVAWAFALKNAADVLQGTAGPDATRGALYYDNPRTATSGWFARAIVDNPAAHPMLATIGGQNFYA